MTPDLEKEIIVGILSALFTAIFTGIPAALLFWWTWQRDQERLTIQKLISFASTVDGKRIMLQSRLGQANIGILVRNRSLFSVHISAVGFEIDGQVIQLDSPSVQSKLKRNPDLTSNRPFIPDDDVDPFEVPSLASTKISIYNAGDQRSVWMALSASAAANKVSVEDLLQSRKVIAMVATETGRVFTSMPLHRRIRRRASELWRDALELKREMDEGPNRRD